MPDPNYDLKPTITIRGANILGQARDFILDATPSSVVAINSSGEPTITTMAAANAFMALLYVLADDGNYYRVSIELKDGIPTLKVADTPTSP